VVPNHIQVFIDTRKSYLRTTYPAAIVADPTRIAVQTDLREHAKRESKIVTMSYNRHSFNMLRVLRPSVRLRD